MNQPDYSSFERLVNELKPIDISKLVVNALGTVDLKITVFGNMSAMEIIQMHDRVFLQFVDVLKDDTYKRLPSYLMYINDGGGQEFHRIVDLLVNYKSHLLVYDFYSISKCLELFSLYQLHNGFWDRSTRKIHDIKQTEISKLKSELNGQKAVLNKSLEKIKMREKEIKLAKDALDLFKKEKERDFKVLEGIIKDSKEKQRLVNDILSNTSRLKIDIEVRKGEFENAQKAIAEYQEKIKREIGEIEVFKESTKSSGEDYRNTLTWIKDQETFIVGKKNELINLSALAADKALGEKFHDRQQQLNKTVLGWSIAVLISVIVAAAWIIIVFKCLAVTTNPPWLGSILTVLKSLPFLLLAGWTIRQYSNERGLQEEYAFKATVAMTLSAYADMFNHDPEKKLQMLLDSTQKVYTKPQLFRSRNRNAKFKVSEQMEALTEILSTLKELKSK